MLLTFTSLTFMSEGSDELRGTRLALSRLRAASMVHVVLAPGLDRADDPRLHLLVADRARHPRHRDREQKDGLLERTRLRPLAGSDAGQDGSHALQDGELRGRLEPIERQPRF